MFRADGASTGWELWKSDGTAAGTVMVKDIRSGRADSSPAEFTAVGNTLYFRADDGTNGYELWKSDGTATGTVMVKDINSGTGGSISCRPYSCWQHHLFPEPTTEPTEPNCGRAMEPPQAR